MRLHTLGKTTTEKNAVLSIYLIERFMMSTCVMASHVGLGHLDRMVSITFVSKLLWPMVLDSNFQTFGS
jgi:hypothetical protein